MTHSRRYLTVQMLLIALIPPSTYWLGRLHIMLAAVVGTPQHDLPCPFCHGTRSFHAFYAADFIRSFRENAFVCAVLSLIHIGSVSYLVLMAQQSSGKGSLLPSERLTYPAIAMVIGGVVSLLVGQWVINIYRVDNQ